MKHSLAVTISHSEQNSLSHHFYQVAVLSLVPHRQTHFNDSDCEKISSHFVWYPQKSP